MKHTYNIILAPLFRGGYGPCIQRPDGTLEIYSIIGTIRMEDNIPTFGTADKLKYLVLHEFSHSFVNPLTSKFKTQINKYESLYNPIAERMKKQAYGLWEACVNEHIIRAVTTRIAYSEGEEKGEQELQSHKERGFVYIDALCDKLEEYEQKRDEYPTFADFYPELIKVFDELSQKDLGRDFYSSPFTGTINAVRWNAEEVVLIVPTNEKDKSIQKEIHTYVKKIQASFYKDSPILLDKEALKADLSGYAIVVYGTPKGNLWLSKYMDKFPFQIKSDRIIADTVYFGTGLRFITAWPNPYNPNEGLLIYTAQQAKDIVEINSVFHGPTVNCKVK